MHKHNSHFSSPSLLPSPSPWWYISFRDMATLMKLRISFLALIMASLGYCIGKSFFSSWDRIHFLWTNLGLLLVGGSCGVLNQFLERELDFFMERTKNRPIPAGRVTPTAALLLGVFLFFLGTTVLWTQVNFLTAYLGFLTTFSYLAIYTPSKRFTSLSTILGAFPGALPPLMGYTAATNQIEMDGLLLFAIVFVWQIPHFLAVAAIFRSDYAKASLPILTVVDKSGELTRRQAILYAFLLIPISLLPSLIGFSGKWYFFGSFILSLSFLFLIALWKNFSSEQQAWRIFFASIIYLPLIGMLMIWDRVS